MIASHWIEESGFLEGAERVSSLPSEIPQTFAPRTEAFDYIKREAMSPMRDGVKLAARL